MFQTNFYGTVSLPLCRILCFKLTTEPPKEQAQRWSFCIIVFFMSTTFYEISRKSAQKAGCCFLPQAYSTRPFVLGGKVPSWTPIAPLIAWVERKHLSWTDKETGKALTIAEIAYLIRGKIKREGIAARNVFASVIANREQWIYQQLNDIEVSL